MMRQSMPRQAQGCRPAFTLVELLVVVSIIVILLALLVPALNRAINASENAKCASNQRNIAQQISGYALGQRYMLPPSVASWTTARAVSDSNNQQGNVDVYSGDFAYAMDYRATSQSGQARNNGDGGTLLASSGSGSALAQSALGLLILGADAVPKEGANTISQKPLGLGILAAAGMLPQTKLGEIAHCPRMNTSSAAPTARFGMDETYAIADGNQAARSASRGAGGSYYVDPGQEESRIIGSYNYRGASWAFARGGTAIIQYSQLTPTFPILVDNPDVRYGRRFTHKDGYYVGYGDGSCRYFEDKIDSSGFGEVEKGQYNYQTATPTSLDGRSGYDPNTRVHMEERGNTSSPSNQKGVWVHLSVPPAR